MPFNTKALKKALGGLIAPQAFNTSVDDYEVVQSTGGSLHSKIIDPLPAGTNEVGSFKLSGRNVQEVIALNALAIVDTSAHISLAIDVSGYKEIALEITTTLNNAGHNADPTISIFNSGGSTIKNSDGSYAQLVLSYATYGVGVAPILVDSAKMAALNPLMSAIKVGVNCANAPTSGSITIKLRGVPN